MNNKILLIETSEADCSCAICENGKILNSIIIIEPRAQARLLVPSIEKLCGEINIKVSDCDAVAVSKGPGSYTGLRVGVSTAKGICFGLDIPLIGIDTMDILQNMGLSFVNENVENNIVIIPMIDARRMEVYTTTYDKDCNRLSDIRPEILDENTFNKEFQKYSKLIFIGDGCMKYKEFLAENISKESSDGSFSQELFDKCSFNKYCPEASYMMKAAEEAYKKEEFEDVAYFEPFYLKAFKAGISKKKLF
ncbi:MAG: tRNA (adenosine(37)-N6)-threonylcarbamoyltransferase complex dimerization subunit type 1 TsaB [Bacteroidales bacterium]